MKEKINCGKGKQLRRYLMVGCFTFPVSCAGQPLIKPPGEPHPHDAVDQPLPDVDVGWDEVSVSGEQQDPSADGAIHGFPM